MTTSRRWPWAVGALAAATVALLVASLLRGAGGPPVIRVVDGGTDDRAMSGEAAPAMDADMMWHPWVEFVLADGARFGPGEATGWRLDAPSDLRAAATRLAERFGVDTSSIREAPYGGGWVAGPEDGSAPNLWVGPSGEWHMSDPTGQPMMRCIEPSYEGEDGAPPPDEEAPDRPDDSEPGEGDTGSVGDDLDPDAIDDSRSEMGFCEPADPPVNVPTAAEARERATSLFADLGLFATPRIEHVHADEWGAWVDATIPVNGMTTDLRVSVAFGAEGRVTWASGTLARPVDVGAYPTIDAEAAVERLQGSPWGGGVMPMPEIDDAEAADDPVSDGDDPVSDRDDAGSPDDAVAPVDPMPRPDDVEVRQVTLVAFEATLQMTWDADGTWWLLPGVRFIDADGGTWQVLIVADEYLDLGYDGGEPGTEPEPVPMPEPPPPDTGGQEPGHSGGGSSGDPGTVDPMMPADEAAESVIGMSEAEATDRLEAMGYEVRVVARDGESFAVTDDYRTDRVNLEIKDGVVVGAYGG
jgi:hypothetical protein